MPCRRILILLAALAWTASTIGGATLRAQVRALPPSSGPIHVPSASGGGPETSYLVVPDSSSSLMSQAYACREWTWQLLPDGLMYRSYLAGGRESRFASQWVREEDEEYWDIALGGRVGILRYGTENDAWPEGWQVDIEGAAFPRLTLDHYRDLWSVDFRFGVPLTFRRGMLESKFSYYHLSSHLGDEYIEKHPAWNRINYARDALVWGVGLRPIQDIRLYAEAGWAFYTKGGAEPWEFQFGFEYSPAAPTGIFGAPFFAVNGRLREEVDYGGTLTVQTGVQWRGETSHLFRLGFHYLNGHSEQFQFHRAHEEQVGLAVWYDY